MSTTRTHLPVFRSAVLALVLSGTVVGGLASTAGAGVNKCQLNPASCTIATAPPVTQPHPGNNPDKPVTANPRPTHPGDNPDKPVADKPRPTHPGDNPDKPVADKPKGDKPGDNPDKPVGDKPKGDKPEGDQPKGDTPVADQPGADEPVDQGGPMVEVTTVDAPIVASANFTG